MGSRSIQARMGRLGPRRGIHSALNKPGRPLPRDAMSWGLQPRSDSTLKGPTNNQRHHLGAQPIDLEIQAQAWAILPELEKDLNCFRIQGQRADAAIEEDCSVINPHKAARQRSEAAMGRGCPSINPYPEDAGMNPEGRDRSS